MPWHTVITSTGNSKMAGYNRSMKDAIKSPALYKRNSTEVN